MINELITPDYLFEASWEVCNKVGGIYTVLSTRAGTLQEAFHDRLFFIGPDFPERGAEPTFDESDTLLAAWRNHAATADGLKVRVGRWNIPGRPMVILVDFQSFYARKNEIYAEMWNRYQVDSLHAYGDYDEASMFACAAGRVVESFYRFNLLPSDKVVFQAHEWMTGMAALYLQTAVPEIATIFTTHATSIGRSIAGNNKPLYDYLFAYNGDQMADELNMQSKHSVEKQTAHHADCFTTVSEITNSECRQLLDRQADVVLMNGFDDDFVPQGSTFMGKRKRARTALLRVAGALTGTELPADTLIVDTSGRYEFKNKGIDVFLEAMSRLEGDAHLEKQVLAVVAVPAWSAGPRSDLQQRLKSKETTFATPLDCPVTTHKLHLADSDMVLCTLQRLGLDNAPHRRVKVLFVPCYLNGHDGIFNKSYYDLLIGADLSVYPSYYEPWGYTPLESIAFHVPTITTDLAGFGRWVQSLPEWHGIHDGVEVLHRSDNNYSEVADGVRNLVSLFSALKRSEVFEIRRRAVDIAEQAQWKHFIAYYYRAYDFALRRAALRQAPRKPQTRITTTI
ncbi:MAG: glycogen/starch synthase [Prevotellaceae bacterium]|jgi:glycosyltransferase involved in cell wall biosynthesis|nr:glycogen/starch synthase [Prevotellaceae bacterium]